MTTAYAERLAAPKPPDSYRVDWDLFAALRAAGVPVRIVAPEPLGDPCSGCPNNAIWLCDAEAWIISRTHSGVYRDPIGRCCAVYIVAELSRCGAEVLRIDLPAVTR